MSSGAEASGRATALTRKLLSHQVRERKTRHNYTREPTISDRRLGEEGARHTWAQEERLPLDPIYKRVHSVAHHRKPKTSGAGLGWSPRSIRVIPSSAATLLAILPNSISIGDIAPRNPISIYNAHTQEAHWLPCTCLTPVVRLATGHIRNSTGHGAHHAHVRSRHRQHAPPPLVTTSRRSAGS